MKIGLVDVDTHHYPNLTLMKLSAWHKRNGDIVSFAEPLESYDKIYASKVFTWTDDIPYSWNCEIDKGGTGYKDYSKVLPDTIEHICPDYSLYGISNVAYGFTTRGCIRHCSFCLVHDKEGMIRPHADIEEFLDGKDKVVLMDNNIVACEHGIKQLEKCRQRNIKVDCNQGLDARIICKSKYLMKLLANIQGFGTHPRLKIACDQKSEIEPCKKTIEGMLKENPKVEFTVYCILTDNQEDSMNRVNQWRKYGHTVTVYAPPYRNFTDQNQVIPKWQKDLARWANNKFLYYSCEFEDYKKQEKTLQEETLF